MRLQQKTQNHTRQTIEKQRIAHQKTKNHIPSYRKNIELRTQKHKITNQITAKNNKKITYQIATKITI